MGKPRVVRRECLGWQVPAGGCTFDRCAGSHVRGKYKGGTAVDDDSAEMMNTLMANGFMLEVFMLQMSLEMAGNRQDPQGWSRDFVEKLHRHIDWLEQKMNDRRYPIHEIARTGFDRLGNGLLSILDESAKPKE
jgi:hypothetical protein